MKHLKKVWTVMGDFATDVPGGGQLNLYYLVGASRHYNDRGQKLNKLVLRCAPQAAERRKVMIYTILGKRNVSFTASDGKTISGTTIYAGAENDDVEGLMVDKFFVTTEKMPKAGIVVGKDVDIYFNKFGKVDKIVPVV